jgi:glutamate formiminotransferase
LTAERRNFPCEKGGYESLSERLKDPSWKPDAGPAVFNANSGATAVGARIPLVAFNVVLNCCDLEPAREIARCIRQSSGGLPHVKAIGIPLESRQVVQVSMNLTDYRETSMCRGFDEIKARLSVWASEILESELIGLVPRDALGGRDPEYFKLKDFTSSRILEECLCDPDSHSRKPNNSADYILISCSLSTRPGRGVSKSNGLRGDTRSRRAAIWTSFAVSGSAGKSIFSPLTNPFISRRKLSVIPS